MATKITRKSNTRPPLLPGVTLFNIVAIIIVVGLIGLAGFLVDNRNQKNAQTASEKIAGEQIVSYDGVNGKNALEILKSTADIRTEETVIGVFVTKINGIENDNEHYWMFYVNNELANVSADQYQTNDTDKVQWRYETFQ